LFRCCRPVLIPVLALGMLSCSFLRWVRGAQDLMMHNVLQFYVIDSHEGLPLYHDSA
jgi:hypothetical protein